MLSKNRRGRGVNTAAKLSDEYGKDAFKKSNRSNKNSKKEGDHDKLLGVVVTLSQVER